MNWLTTLRTWWQMRRLNCRLRRYSPEARAALIELGTRSNPSSDEKIRLLTRALLFYAKGNHLVGFGEAGFEAPDEPNWMCATSELPTEKQWEQLIVEDGGIAAAALRKVYGRKLTKYDFHTSRGHPAALVCSHHMLEAQCWRCHPQRTPI